MSIGSVMDSIVDQLNGDFPVLASEPRSKRSSKAQSRTSFSRDRALSLTSSSLCQACQAVFDGRNASSIHTHSFYSVTGSAVPQRRPGEIQHHGLEDLATRAMSGCHLCLTVYLNIDPENLRVFRQHGTSSACSSSKTDVNKPFSRPNTSPATSSLGFVTITPIARDQAKLFFRYVKAAGSRSVSSPTTESSSIAGSIASALNEEPNAFGLGFGPGFRGFGSEFGLRNGSNSSLAQQTTRWSEFSTAVTVDGTKEPEATLTVELILLNPQYATEPGVQTISRSSTSTGSEESLKIASKWIEDCSFNHMKCTVSDNDVRWKPTHLLDVGIKGSGQKPGVRLVDGVFADPLAEYVTLSHCWGKTKTIQLHKRTLPALRQGVARSDLPKTFAEAAMVTEKLGFRYLWIDALCIMHDSEQAVLNEIAQMNRIYSEASLNIAASGSKETDAGLLFARNVRALQPCVVDVQGHGIDDGTYKVLRSATWHDLVDRSPLSKRAWAFQERALAKRTLHFTRTEVLWECQQMCCSEVYPRGLPVTMATMATQESLRNGWSQSLPLEERFNKKTHHTRIGNWGQLVRMYSAGKLSYRSDKLIAMGGLARQYLAKNRLKESDYVVGLWRPHLPNALMWKVEKGNRPSLYRAPSWTWASVEGRVECPEIAPGPKQACLEIIEIDIKNTGGDRLGLCESGRLRVRGFLARGLLHRARDYWGNTTCTIQFPQAEVTFEGASFDDRLPKLSERLSIMVETLEIYLLPVNDSVEQVEGLFLAASVHRGEFTRIGTFELSHRDTVNWDRFKSVMKGDEQISNYEERLHHTPGSWFASNYTYAITIL